MGKFQVLQYTNEERIFSLLLAKHLSPYMVHPNSNILPLAQTRLVRHIYNAKDSNILNNRRNKNTGINYAYTLILTSLIL